MPHFALQSVVQMSNQGFFGALSQYWTVDEKPRLNRKNSWFDDHEPSNADAMKFGLAVSIIATAIIGFWSIIGVML